MGAPTTSIREQLAQHLDDLPVLPTIVAKLMSLDTKSPSYFDDVLHLVETEPNYSVRVLAMANSAASAPRAPVTTLRAAIARIGSMSASNLVLAISVTRVFVPRDDWERGLWRHALEVALMCRALAVKVPEVDADEAYACGLLHDVGRFVMFQVAPEQLRRIDEGDWSSPKTLLDLELSICGMTHADLGAAACERWGIPKVICATVRSHHALSATDKLTALVHFADLAMFKSMLHDAHASPKPDDVIAAELFKLCPSFLKLNATSLPLVVRGCAAEAKLLAQQLGIG